MMTQRESEYSLCFVDLSPRLRGNILSTSSHCGFLDCFPGINSRPWLDVTEARPAFIMFLLEHIGVLRGCIEPVELIFKLSTCRFAGEENKKISKTQPSVAATISKSPYPLHLSVTIKATCNILGIFFESEIAGA